MRSPKAALGPNDVLLSVRERLPERAWRFVMAMGVEQPLRDAVMFARHWFGPRRPTSRTYSRAERFVSMPTERALCVREVRRETDDTVTLVFDRPEGFAFEPGQYLTFLLPVGERLLRRSYSISSIPNDRDLTVTIKRVDRGQGSAYVHEHVRPGSVLRARGPSGSFTLSNPDAPVLFIAGGSGITPIFSLIRAHIDRCPQMTLLYANRSPDSVIFRTALDALAEKHPNLRVHHVLEHDPSRSADYQGRINRSVLSNVLSGKPEVYLCGPEPMMNAVIADLEALGVERKRVHIERFSSVRENLSEVSKRPQRLVCSGHTAWIAPGKTLLEAGIAAGMNLDFSCTMGGCGACKVRLVNGDVVLDEPNCLTAQERADGFILACVARPKTDVEIAKLQGARP